MCCSLNLSQSKYPGQCPSIAPQGIFTCPGIPALLTSVIQVINLMPLWCVALSVLTSEPNWVAGGEASTLKVMVRIGVGTVSRMTRRWHHGVLPVHAATVCKPACTQPCHTCCIVESNRAFVIDVAVLNHLIITWCLGIAVWYWSPP